MLKICLYTTEQQTFAITFRACIIEPQQRKALEWR